MDTTLPLPFLPSVDLSTPPTAGADSDFTRKQLSYLGCVFFFASDSNIEQLLGFLQGHVPIEAYVDVADMTSIEDIVTILDSGASKVFVTTAQLNDLGKYGDRVVPILTVGDTHPTLPYPNGVLVRAGDMQSTTLKLEILTHHKVSPVFLTTPPSR